MGGKTVLAGLFLGSLIIGISVVQAQQLDRQQVRREIRQENRDIRRDRREIRADHRELRRDLRRGAPPAEIHRDRRELRRDRRELRLDLRQRRQWRGTI